MPNKHKPITTHADPETRPHAEHSPSGLKNFAACPSYKSKGGSNPIAEAGTRIHTAIEKGNPQLLLDGEEQALAESCLNFLDDLRRARKSSADLVASHQEIFLEVDLGEHSTFGTCDLLDIYSDGDATLLDWKTGYGSVDDAENNFQGFCYTLGAFAKFREIERIQLYFVLPRRHEVSFAEFTRADIPRLSLAISTIIARAKELAGVEFSPAEGVCEYCAFQGSCKSLAGKALQVGQKAGFDVPSNIGWDGTPEEKAKLLKLANLLSDWADATKKEILRQALEEGVEIPNYRLESRKTPRTIEAPLLGFAAVSDMMTFEEFLGACTRVSVVELEKIVAEKADRGQKGNARMALECRLRDKGALKEEGVIHVLKAVRK
jgi:RecB family exonuclease